MTPPVLAGQVVRTVLPNGMACLVRPSPDSGAVAIHGFVKAGAIFDRDRPGLARFAGSTLMRGTIRRSGPQLAEDLDAIGAGLTVAPGLETVVLSGRALADDAVALLDTAAEVLAEPAFPEDEVERVRGELVTSARVSSLDTRQVSERIFRRIAYPQGHPHSHNPDGEEAVLASLTPDDLRTFHAEHLRPEAAALVMVGDVDPGRATDLVADAFGRWSCGGAWAIPGFPEPSLPAGIRREESVLPGKSQADLVLGTHGVARTDPDYYAVMLANLLLGQLGMMGRIGENVRERQGMAYYAYSDLRAGLLAGPWWVRAGVHPSNLERAILAITHEIEQLQQDGPTADELADARTYLVGSLAVRLETNQGIAQTLADMELFGLGLDYIERYPEIIGSVSREAIVEVTRRFPTRGYALAIAGPAREG
ncbi:MAG: insulinase family protein [Armatimonadetes bacterium]|nr:insulinase family protein [Armatimonadota bacterium]